MPPNALPTPVLTDSLMAALEYWRSLGGEDLACDWKRFDLFEVPAKLIPSTMVLDIHPDMDNNVYRFWGTIMTRIHGRDMTGKSPYELEPAELARAIRKSHEEIIKKRTWGSSIYTFERHSGIFHKHCTLRLPLSDDGKTVSQIVMLVDVSIADASDRRDLLSAVCG
ncbi:MAG: hypothetical protein ISR51_00155 [Rhodospirillales bacterium]|nr:hypothetical protein [Alphaproteobacteria bacterium]MBL6947061.1 hypothetical protein [Rhodospirillales bacterium]